MMNDALAGIIPYDSIGLYEQPKPRFFFKMPRVVPEQKSKFESDELFRRLSRESEVRIIPNKICEFKNKNLLSFAVVVFNDCWFYLLCINNRKPQI